MKKTLVLENGKTNQCTCIYRNDTFIPTLGEYETLGIGYWNNRIVAIDVITFFEMSNSNKCCVPRNKCFFSAKLDTICMRCLI